MLTARHFFGTQPGLLGSNPCGSARSCTYLESGSRTLGEHSFAGDAHIEGVVIGDISAAGNVTIGEGGRVTSQIRASSIVVAGKVTGDIVGSERIEICRTATVFGNVTSPILLIKAGAGLEGHLSTMSERSLYTERNESELVQMGFPFFKARGQRVTGVQTGFCGCRPSDVSRTPRHLRHRRRACSRQGNPV